MSEMKMYFGSKRIKAMPMTLAEYNKYRGWEQPAGETDANGYLVEYLDSPGSIHPNHPNYISWSPNHAFKKAYRQLDNLTFGEAIELAKMGLLITRAGWNGKGMFVFACPEFSCPVQVLVENIQRLPQAVKDYYQKRYQELDGTWAIKASDHMPFEVKFTGYLVMKTANDELVNGWLASQTDILAEDWMEYGSC